MELNGQRVKEALNSPFVDHVLKYRPDSCTAQLAREVRYMRELVLDAFNQACQVRSHHDEKGVGYDHSCLSTWEEIQDVLLERGIIKEEQCLRK